MNTNEFIQVSKSLIHNPNLEGRISYTLSDHIEWEIQKDFAFRPSRRMELIVITWMRRHTYVVLTKIYIKKGKLYKEVNLESNSTSEICCSSLPSVHTSSTDNHHQVYQLDSSFEKHIWAF